MTTKLFTDKEFEDTHYTALLRFECEQCHNEFTRSKKAHNDAVAHAGVKNPSGYCSLQCLGDSHVTRVICNCAQCGKEISVRAAERKKSKSGNSFCNSSCAAIYNNTHKTTGTRRSKLEAYLEEELSVLYHDLDIIYNDKLAIGSELDIYIPSLRLAFEINGIYHYEPIHGQDRLDSITVNDSHKFRDCLANDISLCVIDTSRQKRFTVKSSAEYLRIICDIINLSGQDSNLQAVVAVLPAHAF